MGIPASSGYERETTVANPWNAGSKELSPNRKGMIPPVRVN